MLRQAGGDYPVPMGGPSGGTGRFQTYTQLTPVTERLERGTVAHDWIPRDTRTLNRVVRLIYLTDAVAGPAIDFYREVPFGPVVLGGIKDENRLKYYYEALENLKLSRHLPYLAGDLLVVGRLICHLLMNESKGMWEEMIVHDSDYIMVEPSPIIGEEPTIDLMVPPGYQKWAVSPDPRIVKQRSRLDKNLVRLMAAGTTIPLSPENTIFIPRRSSANDYTGTSICMRILPIIAIEWAYLNAEVTGLRRRAAPWTIAKMGIEEKWEPSPEEMQAVQDMMVAAEEDPTGAKLVLRNGIEFDQIGGHSDIAKWLEQWPVLKEAKLQGLGMNEAFATGEASWCLPGYSLISTSKGLLRIRDIPNLVGLSPQEAKQIGIISLKGSGLSLTTGEGDHTASSWAYSGKKLVKRLTTDLGYALDSTNEHPVLVLSPSLKLTWTKIRDLKEGDIVALRTGGNWPAQSVDLIPYCAHAYEAPHIAYRRRHSRNLKGPELPTSLSDELAHVLGYLVSEGDCTDKDRLIFGNTNQEVLDHYRACHQEVFPDQHLSCSTVEGCNEPFVSLTTGSWIVREFLRQLGLTFAYSGKKEIPWVILQSTKRHVAKFLSSLFEGDGSSSDSVEYWSSSRKLVHQVHQLLLKFDIVARVDKQGDRWRVRITSRENIQQFINEIDFISTQKRATARALLTPTGRNSRQRWKHIGDTIRQRVTKLLDERSRRTRYLDHQGNVVCAAVRPWRLYRMNPQSEHIEVLFQELEKVDPNLTRKIKRLWSLPYLWDRVSSIKKLGVKPVYDLCVPEHESYVANGFVVHNSYLESMLSLGMERIRNFRQFMAMELIQEGVLAPLAKFNEFYKRSRAEIDHRIRTTKKSPENLDVPSVEWSRSLQPTADRDYLDILEMLEGKGLPVNLRKWAQAGGYDIDEALDGAKSDLELRKRLSSYKKQIDAISGPPPDQEEGAEGKGEGGGYGEGSFNAITARLSELPIWQKCANKEFLTLRRGDIPQLSKYLTLNGHQPGIKEWKHIEAQMLDDGIRMSKVGAFRYLLTRAGVLAAPLAPIAAVKVRDHLIRQANGKAPDRIMMKEIYWINHELERQNVVEPERVVANVTPTPGTAPWVRPAGPQLLTGEGWEKPTER